VRFLTLLIIKNLFNLLTVIVCFVNISLRKKRKGASMSAAAAATATATKSFRETDLKLQTDSKKSNNSGLKPVACRSLFPMFELLEMNLPVKDLALAKSDKVRCASGSGAQAASLSSSAAKKTKLDLAEKSPTKSTAATSQPKAEQIYKKYFKVFSKYRPDESGILHCKDGKRFVSIGMTSVKLCEVLSKIDECRNEHIVKTTGKMVLVPHGNENHVYIIKENGQDPNFQIAHLGKESDIKNCVAGGFAEQPRKVWMVTEGTFLPSKMGAVHKIRREVENVAFLHQTGVYEGFQDPPLMVAITQEFGFYVSPREYVDLFAWMELNRPDINDPAKKMLIESLCIQLLLHLVEMWGRGLRHGDLKPENILVADEIIPGSNEKRVVLKFIDFEGGRRLDEKELHEKFAYLPITHRMCSTDDIIQIGKLSRHQKQYKEFIKASQARDLFNIGIVIFELLAGHPPYNTKDGFPAGEIVEGDIHKFGYDKSLIDFVKGLIHLSPKKRIPFDVIVKLIESIKKPNASTLT
jgi:serine/threonine protein kinase